MTKSRSNATAPNAKGTLVVGSGTDASTTLAVGTDNYVLTADSAEASGVKWAAASAGGMTLISSATFNNTSGTVDFTSISANYKHLFISGLGLKNGGSFNASIYVRLNNNTGGNYSLQAINSTTSVSSANANGATSIDMGTFVAQSADPSVRWGNFTLWIPDYSQSSYNKSIFFTAAGIPGNSYQVRTGRGDIVLAAINRVTLFLSSGNFEEGTIRLYGVE